MISLQNEKESLTVYSLIVNCFSISYYIAGKIVYFCTLEMLLNVYAVYMILLIHMIQSFYFYSVEIREYTTIKAINSSLLFAVKLDAFETHRKNVFLMSL